MLKQHLMSESASPAGLSVTCTGTHDATLAARSATSFVPDLHLRLIEPSCRVNAPSTAVGETTKYVAKPEDEIKDAVKDALLSDPRVAYFDISVGVKGSAVKLRGAVDNLAAKRAAEQDARNTVGVSVVTNRIKVRGAERTDEDIAADIRSNLTVDPYVERYEIDVSVVDGTAYLNGTVDSYFEKGEAEEIASTVAGVTTVRNYLDVDYAGPVVYDPYLDGTYLYDYDWYDYEPLYTCEDDAEIKGEINDELWWSPFVDADQVTVTVDDGVATLTGTVDSWSEYNAATENAYEGGAVWVDNDLDVE
jgi:osmotically-inducible protein OsmY